MANLFLSLNQTIEYCLLFLVKIYSDRQQYSQKQDHSAGPSHQVRETFLIVSVERNCVTIQRFNNEF